VNDMNVTCGDRERIFMDGSPEEWAALEVHAGSCAECGEELRVWKGMSTAAGELRQEWESPYLWSKIERGLEEQMTEKPSKLRGWLNSPRMMGFQWQTAIALALLVIVTGSVLWMKPWGQNGPTSDAFLPGSAVSEVERAEAEYQRAIDKLAAQAQPVLEEQATPLMASYREKLLVLDNAIDELRAEAGQNPANAHLRGQLLAMYREKEEALREILETKR